MKINFVRAGEKKKFVETLKENFGISKLPSVMIEAGKNKIRGFSGSMTREEIIELSGIVNIEVVGLYLFRVEKDIRLGMDGALVLKEQISKNVVEISDSEAVEWMSGKDLVRELESGVYVVKCGEDFLGCGIFSGGRLINHVPKERRIRKSS
jgi:NOL1/NOP2/fmu family ribosome biogenesis protein